VPQFGHQLDRTRRHQGHPSRDGSARDQAAPRRVFLSKLGSSRTPSACSNTIA